MTMLRKILFTTVATSLTLATACSDNNNSDDNPDAGLTADATVENGSLRTSTASYSDPVTFSGSQSVTGADVYEVLPGPAAIDPSITPTPFSDVVADSAGSYTLSVSDLSEVDSVDSTDAVTNVDIRFTGNDGTNYLIDSIAIIHKPDGAGDHPFFGGVGLNKMMHGNTTIGTGLMPKMKAYITLWGIADLKNADTDAVIASGRIVHIMTATGVRDSDKKLLVDVEQDGSDHNMRSAETHVILPPMNPAGEMSPIPGTDHGFLHMMFSNVSLTEPSRDPTLSYEILPGPSAIAPEMSPTPFSDRIAFASGDYSLRVRDFDAEDSPESRDVVEEFKLSFRTDEGTVYTMDGLDIIHKPLGAGDHSFLGGVGFDTTMHGDTGIGTGLMPKMKSYITLWGTGDLLDEAGTLVAANRVVHIMVSSRVRNADLELGTDVAVDTSDLSDDRIETHIILPPQDMAGNSSPIPGTRHGFLHAMFEKVTLTK